MAKNPTDATTRNVRKSNAVADKHAKRLTRLEAKAATTRGRVDALDKVMRYAAVDIRKLSDRLAILEARKG